MMARACYRCHKYVDIQPEDANNQVMLNKFETDHLSHGLFTEEVDALKERYTNMNFLYSIMNRKVGSAS